METIKNANTTSYTNSRCSNHMTAHESLLIDMDTSFKGRVKMRNGNLVDVVGRGTLVNETKKG